MHYGTCSNRKMSTSAQLGLHLALQVNRVGDGSASGSGSGSGSRVLRPFQ